MQTHTNLVSINYLVIDADSDKPHRVFHNLVTDAGSDKPYRPRVIHNLMIISLLIFQLMQIREFKDMYGAIENHHRDLRLAHLTGKAKDLM